MDLFSHDNAFNLLPYDGEVNYFGSVLTVEQHDKYLHYLLNNIEWAHDSVIIYGKKIVTKRKVAWYADGDYPYTYSNTTKHALPFTKELLELKNIVEQASTCCFNSCLLNLYHNGEEAMSWHSDDEKALKENAAIASLSLGAERKFSLKHKTNKSKISINLKQGSLLIMKAETQQHWLHSIPRMKAITTARVNLTFRVMQ